MTRSGLTSRGVDCRVAPIISQAYSVNPPYNINAAQESTLRDYSNVAVRRKWFIIVAVVLAVGSALLMSALQTPVYQASAVMAVRTLPGDSIFGSGYSGYIDPERAIQAEVLVLQGAPVLDRLKADLGLTADPPSVSGSAVASTDAIKVSVSAGDPQTAAVLANAYVKAYISTKRDATVNGLIEASTVLQNQVTDLQAQIDALDKRVQSADPNGRAQLETDLASQRQQLVNQQANFKEKLDQLSVDAALSSGGAQLVQPATASGEPVVPTPLRSAVLALVVGLLIGLGAAFLVDYADDTLRSTEQLEEATGGIPVLAVIPTDPPPDNLPIVLSRPGDFAVEAYRTLRTNLQFLGVDRSLKVVQITSAVAGEGKTTTAANMAVVLAQAGNRVLLVDADLRRPRLHQVFSVDNSRGLSDALLGETLKMLLIPIELDGATLDLLPAGRPPANPAELLGGRRVKAIVAEAAEHYDIVVVDSAPVLPVTDSVALSGAVDGVLVVAQAGRTTTKQVEETVAALNRVGAPLVGMAMNKVAVRKRRGGGYSYGKGYGYGYGGDRYASNAALGGDTEPPRNKRKLVGR